MRKMTLVVVAAMATAVPSLAVAAPGHAKPSKPRAELVTKKVTAALGSGKISALATVKNKGTKTAPASVATFYLSADSRQSADDKTLGTAPVRKVKPKKSQPASGTFGLPAGVVAGSYHVVVCADSGHTVKERKETNNCKGSTGTVAISGTPTTTGPLTVSATAGVGGTVAASAVTGGSCAATTCTFPTPGTGTVTFTPAPASGYRFGTWTGATCTGYTSGSNGKITFTNPSGNKACTATFIKQVTVSFSQPPLGLIGTVSAVATGGSCTGPELVSGLGSCVVDAVTGTVTLTATSGVLPFSNWTGDCSGNTNPLLLSNLSADKTCGSNFSL